MRIFETHAPNWGSGKQCSHQQAGANPCDLGQTAAHGGRVPLLDVHEQPNEFKSGASWCFVHEGPLKPERRAQADYIVPLFSHYFQHLGPRWSVLESVMPIGRRWFTRDKGARELVCKSQSAAPSMQVGSWIACRVCCWFGAHGQCFNGLLHECSLAHKPTRWDRVSPFCSMLVGWWDSPRSVTERRGMN